MFYSFINGHIFYFKYKLKLVKVTYRNYVKTILCMMLTLVCCHCDSFIYITCSKISNHYAENFFLNKQLNKKSLFKILANCLKRLYNNI